MFGQQATRLLKEQWPNAWMLAQELYAMFQDDIPLTQNAPITFSTGDQPPFKFSDWSPGDPLFTMFRPNGDHFGDFSFNPDGQLLFTNPDGEQSTPGGSTTAVNSANTYPGFVVSGSGNTYQVDIYPNGLSQPAQRVSVRQLQIDASETIPAGTAALVCVTLDGSYYMQVPVWLGAS